MICGVVFRVACATSQFVLPAVDTINPMCMRDVVHVGSLPIRPLPLNPLFTPC